MLRIAAINSPRCDPIASMMMSDVCSYQFRVSDELGCIAVRWCGTFSAEACARFFEDLGRNPAFRTCTKLFHDVRQLDYTVESDEVIRAARLPYVEAERDEPLRIALVTSSELGYGMLRILAAIRSREDIMIRIFRSYRQATDWLDLPPHDREVFDTF